MSVEINQLSQLLKATDRQMRHQRELARIKGETFNIFSILNLEENEDRTHSKFIAELLNPKGSHLMGDVFLKAFLEKIGHTVSFDTSAASVKTEKGIGVKTQTTGGIVDILLRAKNGKTITIENKINAGDQENQILRYFNFNQPNNTVYYLTLQGTEPSKRSMVHLIPNQDFHLISYSNTILEWLIRCQEIAVNVAQLREAIKQYYLLIKKLTHQMIDPNNLNIRKLLFEHAESSQYIAENFQNIKNEIKEKFRLDVVNALKQTLDNALFNYAYPHKVNTKGIAQIFVQFKNLKDFHFDILIETFSGFSLHGPEIFIGVLDHSTSEKDYPLAGELNRFDNAYWKAIQYIEIDDKRISLEDNDFLEKIFDPNSSNYKRVLSSFVNQCVTFINLHYPQIESYCNKKRVERESLSVQNLNNPN
ncbi:MAG: PD-(D/E)XK nuclease family protein [Aequorivita sp.]